MHLERVMQPRSLAWLGAPEVGGGPRALGAGRAALLVASRGLRFNLGLTTQKVIITPELVGLAEIAAALWRAD